jgi:ribose/xylose/arabinose/galactoside ABC-type transport system permease subunit
MLSFTGAGVLITHGAALSGLPAFVTAPAALSLAGVPLILVVYLAVAAALAYALANLPFGAELRAIGLNARAARYSGVDVGRVLVTAYVLSGLLSALAGLVMLSRFNSARAGYGESYLLTAILAAVLGGVSPDGGRGTALGVVIAVAALQIVGSLINFVGGSQYLALIAWGAILLLKLAYLRLSVRGT